MAKTFNLADRLKIQAILDTRKVNRLALEGWARRTFRHPLRRSGGLPPIVAAPDHYRSAVLPAALKVPQHIPASHHLSLDYILPYYVLDGIVFNLLRVLPLSPDVPWTPDALPYPPFPAHPEGWTEIQSDARFTALRVQGPNPFLLRRVAGDRFEVDYGPYFAGILDPVCCTFRLAEGRLVPEAIRQGAHVTRPGEDGWERAKFVANALDARFTVFLRHLAHTHLITGEAFALAALALPVGHALRPFLDFFTYGTLVVNDFAFKLLVTPASYFLQSNFITGEAVGKAFANFVPQWRLSQLIPRKDIAERGLDAIPDHPYVAEAPRVWDAFEAFVREHLRPLYADDAAVVADGALQAWHAQLLALLPGMDAGKEPLTGLEGLVELLTVLLYLNVSHEVAGDFSPYTMSDEPAHKKLIHMDHLLAESDAPPRAVDVFLFDQGAYAGRFDNGGNFLMTMDLDAQVSDPGLRASLRGLQQALETLDREMAARNEARAIPFLRLQPHRWKASISY
ncbi:MAG: lipoxygenase family protein [Candidatus Sericytochromatia bacterium]|nr:lipoxygenase family protein [Candidatus Sericytochromatia bacterium]